MRFAGYLILSASVVLFIATVAVAVVSGVSVSFG